MLYGGIIILIKYRKKNNIPILMFGISGENIPQTVDQNKNEITTGTSLSKSELAQMNAFSHQIDLRNSQAIFNYGIAVQKKIADFSKHIIDNIQIRDMDEIHEIITSLASELKNFDTEKKKGIAGLFQKNNNRMTSLQTKYSTIEKNVEWIAKELEKHRLPIIKDIEMLEKLYVINLNYFKELSIYIMAGKQKLQETRETELISLRKKAAVSGSQEDVQVAKDLADMCDRFEKKIHDLDLTRTIAMQMTPQIRMIQNADNMMAEKIQSTIVNTIPLWKNQMVIAIGVEHVTKAVIAQKEVTDMTNELLKKNADILQLATIESAKAAECEIVDMETLKHTNENLIATLDKVMMIQTDGKAKRLAAESELTAIEMQLKNKLIQVSQK